MPCFCKQKHGTRLIYVGPRHTCYDTTQGQILVRDPWGSPCPFHPDVRLRGLRSFCVSPWAKHRNLRIRNLYCRRSLVCLVSAPSSILEMPPVYSLRSGLYFPACGIPVLVCRCRFGRADVIHEQIGTNRDRCKMDSACNKVARPTTLYLRVVLHN